jgi:type II secretory pathway component GspD/PulD (secretin)
MIVVKTLSRALAAAGLAAALLGQPRAASALEPKWPPGPYNYVVVEQDVRDAIIEFGHNVNLPIEVSDEVKGRLRGAPPAGTAEEFFKQLAASYGLVWYFDGSVLHVSAATEVKTEVIELGPLTSSEFTSTLFRLGIADRRYPFHIAPGSHVVSVTGPPPYLNLIRQTLVAMIKQPVALPEDTRVRVFRGTTS